MVSEIKLDESLQQSWLKITGFSTLFRLDRNSKEGGIIYILSAREDVPTKLISS